MQGKHRLECLKRNLEDVNNELSGLEGTVACMKRYRAELVEDQLKVQTAFREHEAHMQAGPWCAVLLPLRCGTSHAMPAACFHLEGFAGCDIPDSPQEQVAHLPPKDLRAIRLVPAWTVLYVALPHRLPANSRLEPVTAYC